MITVNNSINNNVNSYWQTMPSARKPTTTNRTPAKQVTPPMDMQSMFKIMFQVLKMFQSMQGQKTRQTQSIFNSGSNAYPKMEKPKFAYQPVSPSPVKPIPTPATASVDSTAFLFAMLLSQSGMTSVLPSAPATPASPATTPSTDVDLPLYAGTSTPTTTTTPSTSTDLPLYAGTSTPTTTTTPSTSTDLPLYAGTSTPSPVVTKPTTKPVTPKPSTTTTTTTNNVNNTVNNITNLQNIININLILNQLQEQNNIEITKPVPAKKEPALNENLKRANFRDANTVDFERQSENSMNSTGVASKNGARSGKPPIFSPLTFDLNGDGVKTSDKMTQYDIDGDGTVDNINDVADGTLTIRGGATGKDLFGNNTDLDGDGKADGFKNGFDALKTLALQEGLIDGKKDMVLDASDLALLQKKYQLAMKTAGYNSKNENLGDLGIGEINLGKTNATQTAQNFDGQGNDLMTQEGSTFTLNGKTQDYADVWHQLK
jgi:hypothetical protein